MSCNTCAGQSKEAMGAAGVPDSQTQAAWETWQEEPLMRVKRIRKARVFWVIPEE